MPFENSLPDRIIWVSPDGDDSNSGSRDAPLQSIQLAIDRATPGTAILLKPGDYSGNFEFEKIQGTPEKPIWLTAAEGAGSVTITAETNDRSVITIQGEDNLIIRDLVLVGGYDGIEINQSGTDFTNLVHNILIEGNTVIGSANDGIKVGQTSNALVRNNIVDGAGDQGIDLLGVTDSVIDGNEIRNVTGSSGMFVKGGSSDVLITNNYIHDIVAGDGLLIGGWSNADAFLPGTDYEARNVVATGNVVENAAKRPLTVRGAENVDIHDNFFGTMETNESVILIGAGSNELSPPPPSQGVSIHDNVFDRSENFTNIEEGSADISIVDNVKDGVVEGDMRPFPPDLSPEPFTDALPTSLLDAPSWPTSARPALSFSSGTGSQTLTGTSGHDFLSGGSGSDTTIGGAGDDTHSIGSSRDRVIENAGEGVDTTIVYIDEYTLPENVENLTVAYNSGGSFSGNELSNIITGGTGADVLAGGAGDDLFVTRPNGDADVIADFSGGDAIDLRAFPSFKSLADVLASSRQDGADAVIDLAPGDSFRLAGVSTTDLTEDDFLFVPEALPPIVNQPPTDIALTGQSVDEGSPSGTIVGTLSATDADDNETFSYSLIDNAEGRFVLDGTNVVLVGATDFETAASHDITVRVTDAAGSSYDEVLTIDVANLAPAAPTDTDESANSITEGAADGTTVGITALAEDVNGGAVSYALLDDAEGRFAIDALTGVISVANGTMLDYETAAEHTILVEARDAAGAASSASFTISVANEAPAMPEDLNEAANEVSEDAVGGTPVGLAASAADVNGGAISYALLDDAGGRFAIDSETGLIVVADGARLDYETAAAHTIIVEARDPAGAASSAGFTIAVTNVGGATITGTDGDDVIVRGNSVPGQPLPTDENDTIFGGAGNDLIDGLGGDDTLYGNGGADVLIGGDGSDTADYGWSESGIHVNLATGLAIGGDAEGDTLHGIENLSGTSYADTLGGDSGNNVLSGGEGDDTVTYENASAGVKVDLARSSAQDTLGAGVDQLFGFQNVIGSAFDDRMAGDKDANVFVGLGGNDALFGGNGTDTFIGGAGNDVFHGGGHADSFVFELASDGLDTILDFTSGIDWLQISAAGFGSGLEAGAVPTLVKVGSLADASGAGSDGYFIFDNAGTAAGTLYWDVSGGASDDAVAFVKVASGVSILPSDFHVV